MNLSHREAGPADAPALVFLHGFLGATSDWQPIMDSFARDFRCIAIGLPGHGERPTAVAVPPFHAVVDLLRETLLRLRIVRCGLIGYSLGGRLALPFALRHPELVECLVLESASPGIDDPHERVLRRAADEHWADVLEREGLAAFLDAWYAQPLFASLHDQPDLLAELKARRLRDRSDGHKASLAAVLREYSPGFIPSLWPRLPEWRAPLLYVAGERDVKYVATGRRVAGLCPHAALSIVPGSGHAVHEERRGDFLAALRSFPPLAGGFQ